MSLAPKDNRRSRAAFTLVELLIAVSLTTLVSVMFLAVLNAASQLWRNNEQRAGTYREVRAALHFMTRELSTLCVENVGVQTSFLLNPASGIGNGSVVSPGVATSNEWAHRLFFLAAVPGNAQEPGANRGDLCAIGYFLAYTVDAGAATGQKPAGSYKLFRTLGSSDPTYQVLIGNGETSSLFNANPMDGAEVLAGNLSRFTVEAFQSGSGGLMEWKPDEGTPFPHLLQLTLTALSPQDCVRLAEKSAWEDLSDDHRRRTRTFTTRVRLRRSLPPPSVP